MTQAGSGPLEPGEWKKLTEQQLHDLVDEWHGNIKQSGLHTLYAYLGMSFPEYGEWILKTPSAVDPHA